ncbi:GDSL-type esterase/lipase family protein [Schaalia sp. Marseille-Q2122]|uniref:GDSL-type esterase/lipase family protein n=1 Tax=Schaalia sp. Marseille-Q2122 TaxID=2736604 RepID=UPI00158AC948|nr:GDSL-type esterase/lipase family protein [Schaalia sp. Marseille-Q2122]
MRICVIGDELVAGTGDPRALGWVGRVIARTDFPVSPIVMPLAVPGENTAALMARWEYEVVSRWSEDEPFFLVVGIGTSDITSGISTPRSRLNLANILDQAASRGIPCMVVGPPPLAGVDRVEIQKLSRACSEVAQRRGLPFVDTFTPLLGHDQWFEDMAISQVRSVTGATLPGQAGHALMAWLVLHQGWYEWTGTEPRA